MGRISPFLWAAQPRRYPETERSQGESNCPELVEEIACAQVFRSHDKRLICEPLRLLLRFHSSERSWPGRSLRREGLTIARQLQFDFVLPMNAET